MSIYILCLDLNISRRLPESSKDKALALGKGKLHSPCKPDLAMTALSPHLLIIPVKCTLDLLRRPICFQMPHFLCRKLCRIVLRCTFTDVNKLRRFASHQPADEIHNQPRGQIESVARYFYSTYRVAYHNVIKCGQDICLSRLAHPLSLASVAQSVSWPK